MITGFLCTTNALHIQYNISMFLSLREFCQLYQVQFIYHGVYHLTLQNICIMCSEALEEAFQSLKGAWRGFEGV